jgi:glycosyltransferase involved in cell wall biosynthesis
MPKIILAIPVYNEEKILNGSIEKLHNYMSQNIKYDWEIIIADNGSTDRTKEISDNLSKNLQRVSSVHLGFKGRGNALKYVWTNFKADVYAYCDADLATDISNLKELFDSVIDGNNLVIGSRYNKGSASKRTFGRWLISVIYIFCVKLLFKTKICDFQCGFKALDNKIVKEIIPQIKDKEWFFDTELILLAEHSKRYRIKELPIRWQETRVKDSKVKILKTSINYIKNLVRLRLNI